MGETNVTYGESHSDNSNDFKTKFEFYQEEKNKSKTLSSILDNDDSKDLFTIHRLDHSQYHDMRRAFKDDNNYNVWVLSEEKINKLFEELRENYNRNDVQKYLMISFDENNENRAKFRIEAVYGHSFGNYVSCYSEKFIKKLFKTYSYVSLVKTLDKLYDENGPLELGGEGYRRKYEGNFHTVCINCRNPKSEYERNPEIKSEEFFDVVHDPDKPGGGR